MVRKTNNDNSSVPKSQHQNRRRSEPHKHRGSDRAVPQKPEGPQHPAEVSRPGRQVRSD